MASLKPADRREMLNTAQEDVERMRIACLEDDAKAPDMWTVLRSMERILAVLQAHEEEITK